MLVISCSKIIGHIWKLSHRVIGVVNYFEFRFKFVSESLNHNIVNTIDWCFVNVSPGQRVLLYNFNKYLQYKYTNKCIQKYTYVHHVSLSCLTMESFFHASWNHTSRHRNEPDKFIFVFFLFRNNFPIKKYLMHACLEKNSS